jgi:hypothetical protein
VAVIVAAALVVIALSLRTTAHEERTQTACAKSQAASAVVSARGGTENENSDFGKAAKKYVILFPNACVGK